ncbi:MAG TPA: hypothetical protein PK385_10140 [Spirochaetota bacterium]|nr:hypothetical protein [Spirochaetota bacterium]HOS33098.1 hypothetical protein [Spirochaetota bacterium]HOS56405.1 hypothetical protein [Spirochaetota bacterium]HQF77057.1 hypothetical protein [Spirochaetota bacterium]HQH31735.1 hypothetical protein [Spirochaetota bacterium]
MRKRIFIYTILILFVLIGCNNNDGNGDSDDNTTTTVMSTTTTTIDNILDKIDISPVGGYKGLETVEGYIYCKYSGYGAENKELAPEKIDYTVKIDLLDVSNNIIDNIKTIVGLSITKGATSSTAGAIGYFCLDYDNPSPIGDGKVSKALIKGNSYKVRITVTCVNFNEINTNNNINDSELFTY